MRLIRAAGNHRAAADGEHGEPALTHNMSLITPASASPAGTEKSSLTKTRSSWPSALSIGRRMTSAMSYRTHFLAPRNAMMRCTSSPAGAKTFEFNNEQVDLRKDAFHAFQDEHGGTLYIDLA